MGQTLTDGRQGWYLLQQGLNVNYNCVIITNNSYKDMREHPTYKGYFLTEDGRIYSNKRNPLKLITPQKNYRGYYYIDLYDSKTKCRKYMHRLVAETYIPNPNNLPQVNHIDKNKSNNYINNLEWTTNHKNAIHSFCSYKWTIQNIINNEIVEIINLRQFCRDNDLTYGGLYQTLNGKSKHHKNYKIISKIKI